MYKVMKVKPRVARKLESGDHDWCTTDQMDVDWISLTYKDLGFLRRAKAYFKAFHVALTYQKFSQRMRLKIVMVIQSPHGVCYLTTPHCRLFLAESVERVLHREIIKTE